MEIKKETILQCWTCGSAVVKTKGKYFCKNCKADYPVIKGVISAAKNDEVEKLQKAKPNWYIVSQKKVRDIYRHQHVKRKKLLENTLKSILGVRQGKLVFLDIGCGDGINLKEVSAFDKRFDVYGSDYNSLRLLRAKKNAPKATLILADMNKEVIKSGSCDVVLMNHVLEHIPDDVGMLKKMYSYLKPGGFALIGIPQEGTFMCKMRNYVLEPYIPFITDHVHFYTDTEIKGKIKKTGFKIVEFEYLNYHFPHSVIDRHLRKSKKVHDFMERNGAKMWKRGGAGALWIVLQKPKK